jgi:hypothetical protein
MRRWAIKELGRAIAAGEAAGLHADVCELAKNCGMEVNAMIIKTNENGRGKEVADRRN